MSPVTFRTLNSLTQHLPNAGKVLIGDSYLENLSIQRRYGRYMDHLRRFDFWTAGEDGSSKPKKGLRSSQRKAVGLIHAYLASKDLLIKDWKGKDEAALIKMPTGTGKTGVIATIASASAAVKRILILTPRRALVRQLMEDLSWRFWSRFDGLYFDGQLHFDLGVEERMVKLEVLRNREGDGTSLFRLGAKDYQKIHESDHQKQIIVGTFNALYRVLGLTPPAHRSKTGHGVEEPEPVESLEDIDGFRESLRNLDLVIVDEGHYEPAYSWSQCLTEIKAPTVIMTATPYRNDYKYFSVFGNFVFNLPWHRAVEMKLIRDVTIDSTEGRDQNLLGSRIKRFAKEVKKWLLLLPQKERVIIHAANFSTLERLQQKSARRRGKMPC